MSDVYINNINYYTDKKKIIQLNCKICHIAEKCAILIKT